MRARAESSAVGVRELRQNLSVYLVRVQAGEALRVTDRGRVVALLSPLPTGATPMDALIAGGRATAGTGNLADLGPPTGRASDCATRTLLAMRDEERY
jgi:prevent-host-death family protein